MLGFFVFGSQLAISVKSLRKPLFVFSFTFFPPFPSFVIPTFSPDFLLIPRQWVHLFTPFNDLVLSCGVFSAGSHSSVFERFASLCFWAFVYGKGDEAGMMEDTLICEGPASLPGAGESMFAMEIRAFSCYLPLGSLVSTLEKVLDGEVVKKRWTRGRNPTYIISFALSIFGRWYPLLTGIRYSRVLLVVSHLSFP